MNPYDAPASTRAARPAVILAYRFSCAFMLVAWLVLAGLAFANGRSEIAIPAFGATGFWVIAMTVPFKPWGWTYGLVALALGLVTLPLVLAWNKPLVKAAFCRI